MPDSILDEPARRNFLRLGVAITAGLVVPSALTACGGGGRNEPQETFVNPRDIQSVNGVLDITLVLSYLTTTPEHSFIGRHAGGLFVWAISIPDAYRLAKIRYEALRRAPAGQGVQ